MDANGSVTAKAPGRTKITVTSSENSSYQASCTVTVPYKITYKLNKGKGIEIGREEAIAEMIHNMAKCGYSIDKIAEITGRSTEQIQSIMDR